MYRTLGPDGIPAVIGQLRDIYAAVFSLPPYNEGPEMPGEFAEWITDDARQGGFRLVLAHDGERAVGFSYGYTMAAGKWWRGTDRPAPPEVKAADKLAVKEWAVLPEHRGQGVGRRLVAELLTDRPEPWATLTVNPAADARSVYQRWGWRQVASTRPGKMPSMDVLVLDMSIGHASDTDGRGQQSLAGDDAGPAGYPDLAKRADLEPAGSGRDGGTPT